MFADLLDKEIQPENIDYQNLPEISISISLGEKIEEALKKEESKYAHVFERTTAVQTNTNYVFFPNQWYYLAAKCKKYAEALKPYCVFFDEKVRGNQDITALFMSGDYESALLKELIPDETDRERFILFVKGQNDFRKGKAAFDKEGPRTAKDVFGAGVLAKIDVPVQSASYLGNLIYYLTDHPQLYRNLEEEVLKSVNNIINTKINVKDFAKSIVDLLYGFDKFSRLEERLIVNKRYIKINTSNVYSDKPKANWLRSLFAISDTGNFDLSRLFTDEYTISKAGKEYRCKLSNQWKSVSDSNQIDGNVIEALITLANEYYSDVLEIKTENGKYQIRRIQNDFTLIDFPEPLQNGFAYRYVKSLLAKPFVILTGNSGTGKTRIAKQFAEYLEKADSEGERNWLLVPVGSDWTDNTSILGFYNPLAGNGVGKYEKTAIVKLLERANRNPDIPYFLILDEMNLSHVERYFADFLSHMETPDIPFELDGYSNNDGAVSSINTLPYPENLFVVGTVNIDETTYMFSPKVLDRANVIEFKPDKQDVLNMFEIPGKQTKIVPAKYGVPETFLHLAKDIRIEESGLNDEQLKIVKEVFTTVYEIVERGGYEFAYRTVKEIKQYLVAASKLSEQWDEQALYQAIDEQLVQKVLPKIHGNRKEIGKMLEELEMVCNQNDRKLELSARKIEQMKGKLAAIQYASFI